MSKLDAKEALAIYRHFCNETEKVVEFLGVARKLQNLLNVPIPNLRHVRVCALVLCATLTASSGTGVFGRGPRRVS